MTIAFLFPGQGSQSVGMGGAFADASKAAAAVWQEADEALGFSLSRLCFGRARRRELLLTANTQPAVLTASVAAAAALAEHGVTPDLAAGHSLGEYSALVLAAGALPFRRRRPARAQARASSCRRRCPWAPAPWPRCMGVELAAAESACAEASRGRGRRRGEHQRAGPDRDRRAPHRGGARGEGRGQRAAAQERACSR